MKGVGPKTAISLLKDNDDLDGVYRALAEVEKEGPKASRGAIKGALKAKLANDKDNAYLSRHLAEILVDIPLPEEPKLDLGSVDGEGLSQRLQELELNSLIRQVPNFVATFSSGGLAANAHLLATAEEPRTAKTGSKTTDGSKTTPSTEPSGAEATSAAAASQTQPVLHPGLVQTPDPVSYTHLRAHET